MAQGGIWRGETGLDDVALSPMTGAIMHKPHCVNV